MQLAFSLPRPKPYLGAFRIDYLCALHKIFEVAVPTDFSLFEWYFTSIPPHSWFFPVAFFRLTLYLFMQTKALCSGAVLRRTISHLRVLTSWRSLRVFTAEGPSDTPTFLASCQALTIHHWRAPPNLGYYRELVQVRIDFCNDYLTKFFCRL